VHCSVEHFAICRRLTPRHWLIIWFYRQWFEPSLWTNQKCYPQQTDSITPSVVLVNRFTAAVSNTGSVNFDPAYRLLSYFLCDRKKNLWRDFMKLDVQRSPTLLLLLLHLQLLRQQLQLMIWVQKLLRHWLLMKMHNVKSLTCRNISHFADHFSTTQICVQWSVCRLFRRLICMHILHDATLNWCAVMRWVTMQCSAVHCKGK